ncbi:MAG: hypothetical protein GY739_01635 [Mesoflavibacter sp.]|nr:hypothetical protein [Mesoflavibacter sp.]
MEKEYKFDEICDFILRKIAEREDENYELYPYFNLPNGELVSDNGINPLHIVSEFEKYKLSKPLEEERCELTSLGVDVGRTIGFITHKKNENKKSKKKEVIEKRKNANVNFNYFITRPKVIIGIILTVLSFIGIGKYKDIKEYLRSDKENVENQSQGYNKEEEYKSNELEKKKKQELDSTLNN